MYSKSAIMAEEISTKSNKYAVNFKTMTNLKNVSGEEGGMGLYPWDFMVFQQYYTSG